MASGQNKSKKGCVTILIYFLIICFALFLYSYVWIPAIIAIIVFAVKKSPNKKRNLLISIAVCATSFFIFILVNSPTELTSIEVEWEKSEYDIENTAEVTITTVPKNAKIETLSISDNSIADLKYEDGKAIISFKAEGSEELYFIANDKINSNKKTIKVIDAKAEAERIAEEERIAQEQAEAERIAQEQAEAERIAAEQAEAERIAQEQAQTNENNFNTYNNPDQQQTTSTFVLNTSTMKFHYPRCRDVSKIAPQNYATLDGTRDNAISQGYSPCGHCNP